MKKLKDRIKTHVSTIRAFTAVSFDRAMAFKRTLDGDPLRKNRFLVLAISLLLIFDYMVFCYHADKNLFDIFPALPELDLRERCSIYIPANDGKSHLKETRRIDVPEDKDRFAGLLFRMVAKGSIYENTSGAVPVDTYVRTVWLRGDTCYIDAGFAVLRDNAIVIPGSEENFRTALEKSITENIPSIKRVVLLEKGVPLKRLWEVAGTVN
ncbi:MAG: GerMN domain-containing protein [Spirochaetes bacterium]|jgi:hypothetical protein|nr:GerMN domain-containing protein [Spirochaetota bacterium]